MATAGETFASLDRPWQVALSEAWTSWTGGSAGVGAVISNSGGQILAVGRNRMIEDRREAGVLASTFLAHAEMNALAMLALGPTDELTISTTFEPCLMCASAILQFRIPYVRFAAADPVFDGMHDWFAELPFTSDRMPERQELGGRVGAFAHVLHVSWLSFWTADGQSSTPTDGCAHNTSMQRSSSSEPKGSPRSGATAVTSLTRCLRSGTPLASSPLDE